MLNKHVELYCNEDPTICIHKNAEIGETNQTPGCYLQRIKVIIEMNQAEILLMFP